MNCWNKTKTTISFYTKIVVLGRYKSFVGLEMETEAKRERETEMFNMVDSRQIEDES